MKKRTKKKRQSIRVYPSQVHLGMIKFLQRFDPDKASNILIKCLETVSLQQAAILEQEKKRAESNTADDGSDDGSVRGSDPSGDDNGEHQEVSGESEERTR